jgi:hypothetical protein
MEVWPGKSRLLEKSEGMEFAESHFLKGLELWKTVLFSDESKCNVFSSDGCNYV